MTAVVLPHDAASATVARRALVAEITAAGVTDPTVSDAAVVISELVGNAVRHARARPGGVLQVSWELRDDRLEIAVVDGGSSAVPPPVEADESATGGRGLNLVEALSASWGARRHGRGLEVWATLPVSGATGPRTGLKRFACAT